MLKYDTQLTLSEDENGEKIVTFSIDQGLDPRDSIIE